MPSMVHIIGVVSSISPLPLVDAAISIVKAARNSLIQTGKLLHANATPVRAFLEDVPPRWIDTGNE